MLGTGMLDRPRYGLAVAVAARRRASAAVTPVGPAGFGGDRGQLRVGLRRERLACPRVKLVLGQPALYERGLECVNHLLPVGMGRPHP